MNTYPNESFYFSYLEDGAEYCDSIGSYYMHDWGTLWKFAGMPLILECCNGPLTSPSSHEGQQAYSINCTSSPAPSAQFELVFNPPSVPLLAFVDQDDDDADSSAEGDSPYPPPSSSPATLASLAD